MRARDFDPNFDKFIADVTYDIFENLLEITFENEVARIMNNVDPNIDTEFNSTKSAISFFITRKQSLNFDQNPVIQKMVIDQFKRFKSKYEKFISDCDSYLDPTTDDELQKIISQAHNQFNEIVEMMTTAGFDVNNI